METLVHKQPLAKLVDYQDGSIVSRRVLVKDRGNVTLFAFDRDQALSEHTVPHDALVYLVEGTAEIRIVDEPQRLEAGEAVLLPANRPHAVRAIDRFKMVLTMIR
jgi:quercetin dioxygenase-like cupin family protein